MCFLLTNSVNIIIDKSGVNYTRNIGRDLKRISPYVCCNLERNYAIVLCGEILFLQRKLQIKRKTVKIEIVIWIGNRNE